MTTKQRQKAGAIGGAVLTLLALVGLAGGLNQAACPLSDVLDIALRALLAALPSVLQALWHAWQPCVPGHQNLLAGMLPISFSCWQLVLTLSAVA